jgi:sugar transferase EpsL
MDICASALALVLLSPVYAILGVLVFLTSGRPVLFRQARSGIAGRLFTLYKFRTMTNASGPDGRLLSDDERLTRLGRIMRRWSLDELPQFWNVLRGDMSLVGPRPLPAEYLARYNERQARRSLVRPGITGIAQASWRAPERSWEEKLELDVFYVEHQGLLLDLKILMMTFAAVFRRAVANRGGASTSEQFEGAGRSACPEGQGASAENGPSDDE